MKRILFAFKEVDVALGAATNLVKVNIAGEGRMRVCPGPPKVRVSVLYIVRVTPRLALPGALVVAV
jgi:hypothetical protein